MRGILFIITSLNLMLWCRIKIDYKRTRIPQIEEKQTILFAK